MSASESNCILFVFTSASEMKKPEGGKAMAGWYLPEAAHPYDVLSKHFTIEFASPAGPNPPLDLDSEAQYKDDEICQRFLKDADVTHRLKNAKCLKDVKSDDYIAIYYPGGHGALVDLPLDASNIKLAEEFYRSGKLIGAVSHGPGALTEVERKDGRSIFRDIEVTAFSIAEERDIRRQNVVPFFIEKRIRLLGGIYVKADELWKSNVIRSGNLITGQNPQSARKLAEDMKAALQQKGNA